MTERTPSIAPRGPRAAGTRRLRPSGAWLLAALAVACDSGAAGPAPSGGAADGAVTAPDGAAATPDGAVVAPDAASPDGGPAGPDGATPSPVDPGLTWSGGVGALLGDNCAGCHTDGGIGPFPLDDYESAQVYGAAALAAVEAGRMPPWMPDPDCREYEGQRILAPDEVATLRGWVEAGTPRGEGATAAVPEGGAASGLGEPTLRLTMAAPYTPNPERPDDYRCFLLDHTFAEESFLVASQVHPDQRALVHHVLLYRVPAEMVAAAQALDGADDVPGYACFGGPGVSADTIGAWVPGSVPITTPDDTAIRLPPGSRIVLQIHYNVLSQGPAPDQSSLDLWLQPEQPAKLLTIDPLAHLGIDIPAGEAASLQTKTFTNKGTKPWTIVGTAPHMHLLGERIAVTALHADGEECVVDIPRWDFNWQQTYRFLPGQEVVVEPGESIRLDCVYDNSASNQPVINGVQQSPVDVKWGEGTLDEMCLNYIMRVAPYEPLAPAPAVSCDGFDPCYAGCRAGEGTAHGLTACTLLCGSQSSSSCTKCVVQGLLTCTPGDCGPETSGLLQCLTGCQGSADFQACMAAECDGAMAAFDACAEPVVEAGTCDAALTACAVTMAP